MPVKVSVIVPVYNPGAYIEECVASLLRQSLPRDAYEVIFVDDGSTDGTPARLDGLAAADDRVRVIHQENSGWPGRPRNVENAPLIDSLTPHKMVRKAFLDCIGLRFPEGRRRLEDHVFVTEAYLRAGNVAVLGDYVCYYHVRRDDDANAGFQRFGPGVAELLQPAQRIVAELAAADRYDDVLAFATAGLARRGRVEHPVQGGAETRPEVGDPGGHVGAPDGLAALVGDDVDGVAAPLQAEHGAHEAAAVGAVEPGGADDGARVRERGEHGPFAGELGAAVGGAGGGRGVLGVGGARGAGEDVVGGDVDQPGAVPGAGAGQVGGAVAVDPQGAELVVLGGVHGRVGGAVDDQIGAVGGDRVLDRVGAGDVQGGAVEAGDVLAAPGQFRDGVPAEHPGGPDDEPPHVVRVPRFNGSHQSRCSRYQATVAARPVRKSWQGR